jgi:hypothetical protein
VAAAALILLASNAKPLPPIANQLEFLPEAERAALQTLCVRAGLPGATSLRPLGGAYDGIFRAEANRAAVWIDEGHVRALGFTGAKFTDGTAVFREFPKMEVLWLENSNLSVWPDLSSLNALRELNVNGNPLASPPAGPGTALPPGLQRLQIARARLSALDFVANHVPELRELDASGNAELRSLDPLLKLAKLERVHLAQTGIAALPDTKGLPKWEVDLEGTPVLNPPGFSWKGPGSHSFTGTGLGETSVRGMVSSGQIDVTGSASEVPALRPVSLPTNHGGSASIGPVIVEATIATGKARIWLAEGPGWFSSPWFTNGKVKGFGFARKAGWSVAEIEAGATAQARGALVLNGPIEHHDFQFYIEPVDGTRVTGLRYRVYPAKR